MINHRLVCTEDAYDIVELLRILRLESPEYNYVDDDPEFVRSNLGTLIHTSMMRGVVALDGQTLVGFMIGFVGAPWYSRRVEAMEQLLYVDPAWRGGTLAFRLVHHFEAVCREAGAANLMVGASTGMAEERTVMLYERMGYTKGSPTLRKAL